VFQLRRESTLAVVGSRFENFPYSVAEAMAVGMPVLASESYGNAEMIRDKIDGRLVPIGDVRAMAEAIISMVTDPLSLARMGASAHLRAKEWLAPSRVATDTVSIYRQVIARSRSS
jgi:glycosyltransferase involved in cell wall biosynthesis